ncbi:UNVERIFIED_CONTAM: putative calcium-transporting ATPase 13, plasma membrane-type [Sesamum angustifolium]|uniref:Calcium-transporting ATPase 13, plasma membrane-type n=1 Tax=Sesamum angustifolium TaxID=2727405 RepID=A0AAW2JK15_9LAMI
MDKNGEPSSSVYCYRKPAPQSVSVIHQGPSLRDAAVIQMQQFDVVGGPADNLQRPNYTRQEPNLFSRLVEGRVMDQLIEHGGVQGVAATLETHIQNGIHGSSEDINDVMRHGRRCAISKFEIVVGDIVCLKNGNQVPADGIFIKGSLKVDESRMAAGRDRVEINHENPFLSSGSKIIDGCATMLVTAVGMKTSWGRMMSTIVRDPNEETPLHDRSRKLTLILGMFGLAMALLVLVRQLVGSLVDITATAVIILVVAIRGGFSMAINLTLAHSTKRMMADQAVVRNLSACEVLASAKTICTDMKRIIASNQIMSFQKMNMQQIKSWGFYPVGIRDAFQVCRRAGIHVKLVTSENVFRARAMVLECGILSPGEEVSERLVWKRKRSSTTQKRNKDSGLRHHVTGDCANDAPTLQEANVGIAMGKQSTEVAKECSDILILDDNFANVVKVVLWVRCIRNNIQKFNQFQLTANLAFLMIYTVFPYRAAELEAMAACIGIAAFSWPFDWLVKCIPVPISLLF